MKMTRDWRAWHTQRIWASWDCSSWGRKGSGGILPMPINTWRESAKRMEPGSFQRHPVPGQEAVNTNQNTGAPSEHQAVLCGAGWLAQVAQRLLGLLFGDVQKPWAWAPYSGCPCWNRGGPEGHRRPCQPQLFWDSVILRKKDCKICQQIVHGHNTDVKGQVSGQSVEELHFNLTKWSDHGAKQKQSKSKAAGSAEIVWESLITKVGTSLPSSSATNSPHPTSDNMQFLCMNSVCVLQISTILHLSRVSGNLRCMFQKHINSIS